MWNVQELFYFDLRSNEARALFLYDCVCVCVCMCDIWIFMWYYIEYIDQRYMVNTENINNDDLVHIYTGGIH